MFHAQQQQKLTTYWHSNMPYRPSTTHAPHSFSMHTRQIQFELGKGGGSNKGSLPWAPSVRGPPNSAELVQMHILQIEKYSVRGLVDCVVVT